MGPLSLEHNDSSLKPTSSPTAEQQVRGVPVTQRRKGTTGRRGGCEIPGRTRVHSWVWLRTRRPQQNFLILLRQESGLFCW